MIACGAIVGDDSAPVCDQGEVLASFSAAGRNASVPKELAHHFLRDGKAIATPPRGHFPVPVLKHQFTIRRTNPTLLAARDCVRGDVGFGPCDCFDVHVSASLCWPPGASPRQAKVRQTRWICISNLGICLEILEEKSGNNCCIFWKEFRHFVALEPVVERWNSAWSHPYRSSLAIKSGHTRHFRSAGASKHAL